MPAIENLICLTPRDSYVVDCPLRGRGLLGRLEHSIGPFVRSPGIGFPYLVGFLRKTGFWPTPPGSSYSTTRSRARLPSNRF